MEVSKQSLWSPNPLLSSWELKEKILQQISFVCPFRTRCSKWISRLTVKHFSEEKFTGYLDFSPGNCVGISACFSSFIFLFPLQSFKIYPGRCGGLGGGSYYSRVPKDQQRVVPSFTLWCPMQSRGSKKQDNLNMTLSRFSSVFSPCSCITVLLNSCTQKTILEDVNVIF